MCAFNIYRKKIKNFINYLIILPPSKKGYKKEKRYIATQGPKPNTVVDFWRMIWQENVLIICMLANVIESGKVNTCLYSAYSHRFIQLEKHAKAFKIKFIKLLYIISTIDKSLKKERVNIFSSSLSNESIHLSWIL